MCIFPSYILNKLSSRVDCLNVQIFNCYFNILFQVRKDFVCINVCERWILQKWYYYLYKTNIFHEEICWRIGFVFMSNMLLDWSICCFELSPLSCDIIVISFIFVCIREAVRNWRKQLQQIHLHVLCRLKSVPIFLSVAFILTHQICGYGGFSQKYLWFIHINVG